MGKDKEENGTRKFKFYVTGDLPKSGEQFCYTCCAILMGEMWADEKLRKEAKQLADKYEKQGLDFAVFKMPNRPDLSLYVAITFGPSVFFQFSAPVCWHHMQGLPPEHAFPMRPAEPGSSLIAGKRHEVPEGGLPNAYRQSG